MSAYKFPSVFREIILKTTPSSSEITQTRNIIWTGQSVFTYI